MTWNKYAEHEPDSKFFVQATDIENGFSFFIFLYKKNKPAKTDYYANLFGNIIENEYEIKMEEIFREKINCNFGISLSSFNALDISIIDKMPEISELYSSSPKVIFYFDRNYNENDNQRINKMVEYLSPSEYKNPSSINYN